MPTGRGAPPGHLPVSARIFINLARSSRQGAALLARRDRRDAPKAPPLVDEAPGGRAPEARERKNQRRGNENQRDSATRENP